MTIHYLTVKNFRNLTNLEIHLSPSVNLIIGKNGSGKTSLLEAIYFLSVAKSFRTAYSNHLIQFGTDQFQLFTRIKKGESDVPIGIVKKTKKIKIKMANEMVSSASTLASYLPIQVINPDSHRLVEEGPRYRRRFLEWGLFHVKPSYLELWQKCRHILKQRNAALKSGWKREEMRQWNLALLENAKIIDEQRREHVVGLNEVLSKISQDLELPILEKLNLQLKSGWPKDRTLEEALESAWELEQKKGFTQYGPHKADLEINVATILAKNVVSRGQQKLITVVLKLAQMELLKKHSNHTPILLVDDIAAEFDDDHRNLVLEYLAARNYQTFFTATSLDDLAVIERLPEAEMFHVEHGNISSLSTEVSEA